ncbi:MAG: hypothetical protein LBR53_07845 [Deltaproteobacteria bacterium]|jgi:hypothetical protein|nr:hypothetical protein [Deltaproteobacteria bacterium]
MKTFINIILPLTFLFITFQSVTLHADPIQISYKTSDVGYLCDVDEGGTDGAEPTILVNNAFGSYFIIFLYEDYQTLSQLPVGTPIQFNLIVEYNTTSFMHFVVARNITKIGDPVPGACKQQK